MLKHLVALIALSVGMVLAMSYAQEAVQLLLNAHSWISKILSDVFSGAQAGSIARDLIALLSIPLLVGLIPAIVFWMLRRRWLSCFIDIVWVVWLVQAGALAMTYKAAVVG